MGLLSERNQEVVEALFRRLLRLGTDRWRYDEALTLKLWEEACVGFLLAFFQSCGD
jgi:hypothetical protein